jgi:protein TonB
MNTMPVFPAKTGPAMIWPQIKRIGPLGVIIVLHIGFFYALQSGLLRQAAHAALPQREVFASFIAPDPEPQPAVPKPPPAAPKTVPVVKKTAPRPAPIAPEAKPAPVQQAITVPAAPPSPEPPADAAPAAPQVAAAVPAQPKTISGVEYIQAPQPDYPPVAKRMGEEGKAILRVLVNEKGRPERIELQQSSGSARLDEAARQAVLRAIFKPYVEDGRPLAVYAIVPIRFQLNS